MKILYVTTVGGTMDFFKTFIEELIMDNNVVDVATNYSKSKVPEIYERIGCRLFQIDISRTPLKKENVIAIRQIRKLVEKEKYDIVHCHTPIAAMCTRIACLKARGNGTKVIYTAHGFHFYKGAPLKNWLIFYPIEKLCSYFTDVLITINKEDYTLAQKKMCAKRIEYVHGVGIDLEKFNQIGVDKIAKREEIGIPKNVTLLLSVGELNKNKNHEMVIRAIADMKDVYYIIAGSGGLHQHLQNVIEELGMRDRVKLLGYRNDILELYKSSDVFVFPSFREGLSVSVMEAMACGLPVVCSRIRGNIDLIDEIGLNAAGGGVFFKPSSTESCKKAIEKVLQRNLQQVGKYNKEKIDRFEINNVNAQMKKIYIG